MPADIHQTPIAHARRAGGFARAARQAAVEMELRARGRLSPLEHLLDEVDAATRAVELIAQQLVGRAGRRAHAAMRALAQDRVRLPAFGCVADKLSEVRLHRYPSLVTHHPSLAYRSGYIQPGLRMPEGSKTCFKLRCSFISTGESGWKTPADRSPRRNSVA